MEFVIALLLICCVLVFGWYAKMYSTKRLKKHPPWPCTLPFIGNLHQLKGAPSHEAFQTIAKQLGSVFSLWTFNSRFVVVNSYPAAVEVLATNDAFLAGRPQRYTGALYSNGFKGIIVTDYNKDLIKRRKIVHSALKLYGSGFQNLEAAVLLESDFLIARLRQISMQGLPVDPRSFVSLSVTNVICALVFGSRYNEDDEEFQEILKVNEWIMQGITEAQLLDALPLLRVLPNKKLAFLKKAVARRNEILERKLIIHEETYKEQSARDLTDGLLNCLYAGTENGKTSIDREMVKMIIADVFIAGAQTTAEALLWCLLYFTAYPDVQAKIRAQIDDFRNNNKGVSISYQSSCPYLTASIYEVLRMATVSPIGLPHKALEDTTVSGYDVPKDTLVILNFYAMHHDPCYWSNVNQFKPERFLDEKGELLNGIKSYFPFSSGRRNCLGEKLAKTELFLMLFSILASFTLEKASPDFAFDFKGDIHSTANPGAFQITFKERQ